MGFLDILKIIEDFLAGSQINSIYWVLALVGSAIYVIQIAMTLFGFGVEETGADSDIDGDGDVDYMDHQGDGAFGDFKFFSIRTAISFITFFGWGGVIWEQSGWSRFLFAFICGFAMMFFTAVVVYFLLQLQQTGNITGKDIVGCTGTAYLSIPGGRKKSGKATISVKGSTRELTVVSDKKIKRGSSLKVVGRADAHRYIVEEI